MGVDTDWRSLTDDLLVRAIEQIIADKDYILENHTEPWAAVVPRISSLIRKIVTDVYEADLDHVCRVPFSTEAETVRELMERSIKKLETDFTQSPPFTVHHLVRTLTFATPGYQLPRLETLDAASKEPAVQGNPKRYTTTVDNTITKEKMVVESTNNYHQPMHLQSRASGSASEAYAVKYLRALERSVFVQSTIADVNRDLADYGSENTTEHAMEKKGDAAGTAGSVQMVKIAWAEEAVGDDSPAVVSRVEQEVAEPPEGSPMKGVEVAEEVSPKRSGLSAEDEERVVKRTKSVSGMREQAGLESVETSGGKTTEVVKEDEEEEEEPRGDTSLDLASAGESDMSID